MSRLFTLSPPRYWYGQTRSDQPFYFPLLRALGAVWGAAARLRRLVARPYAPHIPVVCIGNITVGGTGKTPTAIALVTALLANGTCRNPCFLTRGYGGRERGPVLVDAAHGSYPAIGDEALLLARHAPTLVARDRVVGLKLAERTGFDLVIVDDGFQNPSFAKRFSLLVFDGASGLGNGLCLPAGPCRERPADALRRADAALVIGEDSAGITATLNALAPTLPVAHARLTPARDGDKQPCVAFAGIGRPDKFFETLEDAGFDVRARLPFPDHHAFTADDISQLMQQSARRNARLITTEKDFVRVPPHARTNINVLPVTLSGDAIVPLVARIKETLAR